MANIYQTTPLLDNYLSPDELQMEGGKTCVLALISISPIHQCEMSLVNLQIILHWEMIQIQSSL